MSANITLILGGAWSGKTARAAKLASQHQRVTWMGTATESLPDLADHVRSLRAQRPAHWHHLSAPFDLVEAVKNAVHTSPGDLIVIDSVSQWIANLVARSTSLHDEQQAANIIARDVEDLCQTLRQCVPFKELIIVSGDFGQSMPPQDPHQRLLRRSVGQANHQLAAISRTMEVIMAGVVIFTKNH